MLTRASCPMNASSTKTVGSTHAINLSPKDSVRIERAVEIEGPAKHGFGHPSHQSGFLLARFDPVRSLACLRRRTLRRPILDRHR